jgi:hypothetical protein
VSKICTELDAHLGLADKTLAEFIIHLADEHTDPKVRPFEACGDLEDSVPD